MWSAGLCFTETTLCQREVALPTRSDCPSVPMQHRTAQFRMPCSSATSPRFFHLPRGGIPGLACARMHFVSHQHSSSSSDWICVPSRLVTCLGRDADYDVRSHLQLAQLCSQLEAMLVVLPATATDEDMHSPTRCSSLRQSLEIARASAWYPWFSKKRAIRLCSDLGKMELPSGSPSSPCP